MDGHTFILFLGGKGRWTLLNYSGREETGKTGREASMTDELSMSHLSMAGPSVQVPCGHTAESVAPTPT